MIIKDQAATEWRLAHSSEIQAQIKDYCDKALRRSNSIKSRQKRETGLTVMCGWKRKLPNEVLKTVKDPYLFLDDFVDYMVKIKLSSCSINNYVSVVRKWLKSRGFDIDRDDFLDKVELPKKIKITKDKTPNPAEMKKILEHTNLRGKALLAVTCSSGMRIGEVISLKIEDIDFSIHPTSVHIWPLNSKTDVERWTFISDEATEFLKLYINGRKDGFVFLGRHQGVKPDGTTFLRGEIAKDEPMSYWNADYIFTTALENAELRRLDDGGRDVFHLHKLRYFFKTNMGPYMDSQYVEAFMGHGKNTVKHLYDETPIEELAKIYEKGMFAVTILNRTDPNTTKKVSALEEEVNDLRLQLKRYEDLKIPMTREDMEAHMNKLFKEYMEAAHPTE
jgi:integrase